MEACGGGGMAEQLHKLQVWAKQKETQEAGFIKAKFIFLCW